MVNGKLLVQGGELLDMDLAALVHEHGQLAKKLRG